MTLHPVTVYRHGADLLLCYPLMWNITLEYTATHFNVFGQTRPRNPFPDLPHTRANAQLLPAHIDHVDIMQTTDIVTFNKDLTNISVKGHIPTEMVLSASLCEDFSDLTSSTSNQ